MKYLIITLFVILTSAFFWGISPIPQELDYHLFADQRNLLGIPHTCNVLSNLPFLVVGVLGVIMIPKINTPLHWSLFTMYIGAILVGFGSGYYHLEPSNETLVWDRLSMTIAFMGFFSFLLGDQIHERMGRRSLAPLLGIGIFSVVYWIVTENQLNGDLRLYVLVQFIPMIAIPTILIWQKKPFSETSGYWLLLICYGIAKATEYFDLEIYQSIGMLVSGHSIKHVISALGLWFFLHYIDNRKKLTDSF